MRKSGFKSVLANGFLNLFTNNTKKNGVSLIVIGKGEDNDDARRTAMENAARQILMVFDRDGKTGADDAKRARALVAAALKGSEIASVSFTDTNGAVVVMKVAVDFEKCSRLPHDAQTAAASGEATARSRMEELARTGELEALDQLVGVVRRCMPAAFTPELTIDAPSEASESLTSLNIDYRESNETKSLVNLIRQAFGCIALPTDEAKAYAAAHPDAGRLVVKDNQAKPTEQGRTYLFRNDEPTILKWKQRFGQAMFDAFLDFEVVGKGGQVSRIETVAADRNGGLSLNAAVGGTGIFALGRAALTSAPSDSLHKLLTHYSTTDNVVRMPTFPDMKQCSPSALSQHPSWFIYRVRIVISLPPGQAAAGRSLCTAVRRGASSCLS